MVRWSGIYILDGSESILETNFFSKSICISFSFWVHFMFPDNLPSALLWVSMWLPGVCLFWIFFHKTETLHSNSVVEPCRILICWFKILLSCLSTFVLPVPIMSHVVRLSHEAREWKCSQHSSQVCFISYFLKKRRSKIIW